MFISSNVNFISIFVVFFATIIGFATAKNYSDPTLCTTKYQWGNQFRCENVLSRGLTEFQKMQLVNKHNELRGKVGQGLEYKGNPGPQPAAFNMVGLKWDRDLAVMAQNWADQCTFGHDRCKNDARFQVGQNIAFQSHSRNALDPSDLVQMWYDEVQYFNRANVGNFARVYNFGQVSHYTQLVWAKTTHVGCGAISARTRGMLTLYLVCNYGPAGNVLGQEIYKTWN